MQLRCVLEYLQTIHEHVGETSGFSAVFDRIAEGPTKNRIRHGLAIIEENSVIVAMILANFDFFATQVEAALGKDNSLSAILEKLKK